MPRLYPLFSGSSGNCYYLGTQESGILIDAGRSARQIETALQENELDINHVQAIFVTHEHTDHIQGLRVLASRHKLPVYASKGTIQALADKALINDKVNIRYIDKEGMELSTMKITPFATSHDCAQGFGYVVETSDGRKTAFATDTGCVTEDMINTIRGCDTAVIESNHDVTMLESGFYPYILKKRILSDVGHLSNDLCADTVAELIRSGSTRFILAHLSKENNLPELAEQTTVCTLTGQGMKRQSDYLLTVAAEKGSKPIIY